MLTIRLRPVSLAQHRELKRLTWLKYSCLHLFLDVCSETLQFSEVYVESPAVFIAHKWESESIASSNAPSTHKAIRFVTHGRSLMDGHGSGSLGSQSHISHLKTFGMRNIANHNIIASVWMKPALLTVYLKESATTGSN